MSTVLFGECLLNCRNLTPAPVSLTRQEKTHYATCLTKTVAGLPERPASALHHAVSFVRLGHLLSPIDKGKTTSMRLSKSGTAVTASVLSILSAGTASADTILVPADQATIQDAINAAVIGDTVLVAAGTYTENINFAGKDIIVESEDGATLTTINGARANSVVTFTNGETRNAILRGFTITNGLAGEGGGIVIPFGSPTIENNVISGNGACSGAGIGVASSSPLIQNNTISNNTEEGCSGGTGGGINVRVASSTEIRNNLISGNSSRDGAGIAFNAAGSPVVSGNEIRGNTAVAQGGAIFMLNRSDALIEQNLIVGNSAAEGGGIVWRVPASAVGPKVIFNTFYDNAAPVGSGIWADGFDQFAEVTNNIVVARAGETAVYCENFSVEQPQFSSNLIYSDGGQTYDGICLDQTGMNGNLSGDPLYADAVAGDFRLQPASSAIDAAIEDPSVTTADYLANIRPVDGNGDSVASSDMGAYEAHPPSANAGADQTVDVSASVSLDGSASSDADGTVVSYSWTQTVGTAVTLINEQTAMPSFDAPGNTATLTFELIATDDLGFEGKDEVQITVNAPPPPPPPPTNSGGGGLDPALLLLLLVSGIYQLTRKRN